MKNALRLYSGLLLLIAFALAGALWVNAPAHAEVPKAPEIGTPMPDFTLKDCEGNAHKLSSYQGKIVVLEFTSIKCPYARGVAPTIKALSEAYGEKGVVFLGVNANKSESPEAILAYNKEVAIPHPVLKDTDNAYANAVGAKVTPEIYVIDPEGKLAFHGAPDNRNGPEGNVTETYLKDALDALLAKKPVPVTTKRAWGCGIERASR